MDRMKTNLVWDGRASTVAGRLLATALCAGALTGATACDGGGATDVLNDLGLGDAASQDAAGDVASAPDTGPDPGDVPGDVPAEEVSPDAADAADDGGQGRADGVDLDAPGDDAGGPDGAPSDSSQPDAGAADVADVDADDDTPGEPDVTPDPGGGDADDTGDAPGPDGVGPDAEPIDSLPLPDGAAPGYCASACEQLFDGGCPAADLAALGATADACVEACVDKLETDGAWAANFQCLSDSCDAEACGFFGEGAGALPVLEGCVEGCDGIYSCGLAEVLELPPDLPEFCVASCSGSAVTQPDLEAVLDCVATATASTCDPAEVMQCLEGTGTAGLDCADACEQFYDPTSDQYCEEGSGVLATWPTATECVAACSTQDSAPLTFFGCMLAVTCGPVDQCATLPASPDAGCLAACAAGFELCGEGGFGAFSSQDMCDALCSGFVAGLGAPPQEDPGECVTALGACPDGDSAMGDFLSCVVDFSGGGPGGGGMASPTCQLICGTQAACTGAMGFSPECLAGCAEAEASDPSQVTEVAMCISAAGSSCVDMLACIPAE